MEVRMAHQDWSMKGPWLKNCNCAYGCPCDFNARPTHGHCEGMVGMKIESGHFGDVDLSGLLWAAVYHWPGALHEGNGTMQPIIDEISDERQRSALLTILSGLEQNDGTFLHIVSMIVDKVLEPQFVPMEFEFDLENRTARFLAPGIFETVSKPILNPVTGEEYRVQVSIPQPFEYGLAEIASAAVNKGTGTIKYDWPDSHSSMSYVEHTPAGVVQH
jgi:hypothetical protein